MKPQETDLTNFSVSGTQIYCTCDDTTNSRDRNERFTLDPGRCHGSGPVNNLCVVKPGVGSEGLSLRHENVLEEYCVCVQIQTLGNLEFEKNQSLVVLRNQTETKGITYTSTEILMCSIKLRSPTCSFTESLYVKF